MSDSYKVGDVVEATVTVTGSVFDIGRVAGRPVISIKDGSGNILNFGTDGLNVRVIQEEYEDSAVYVDAEGCVYQYEYHDWYEMGSDSSVGFDVPKRPMRKIWPQ